MKQRWPLRLGLIGAVFFLPSSPGPVGEPGLHAQDAPAKDAPGGASLTPEEPGPAKPGQEVSGQERPGPQKPGSGKAPTRQGKAADKEIRPAPPESVALPDAGAAPAESLLAIAGVLSGLPVRVDDAKVTETPVVITTALARNKVNLEELSVLLAAHKIFLFEFDDPEEGKVLVATRNPRWTAETRRFTRVLQVDAEGFAKTWGHVQAAVREVQAESEKREKAEEKAPEKKAPGEAKERDERPGVVAIPDERTGKIIIGSTSKALLEAVLEKLDAAEKRKGEDPERPRLFTYSGKFRSVADLEAELLSKLSESERKRVHIVQASKGNRLLFRTTQELWDKSQSILKGLDRPPRIKLPAPRG